MYFQLTPPENLLALGVHVKSQLVRESLTF